MPHRYSQQRWGGCRHTNILFLINFYYPDEGGKKVSCVYLRAFSSTARLSFPEHGI